MGIILVHGEPSFLIETLGDRDLPTAAQAPPWWPPQDIKAQHHHLFSSLPLLSL